jgi:Leucine-rich repeat (LRR) protein
MKELAITGCKSLNDVWAPYNDIERVSFYESPNIAFINLAWNDLSYLDLSNMSFLQRLNVSNNQLLTLNVSFDPILTYVNLANNFNLNAFLTQACPQLYQVVGIWENEI